MKVEEWSMMEVLYHIEIQGMKVEEWSMMMEVLHHIGNLDATFCKSILLGYVVKMRMGWPTYTTSQAEGVLLVFISSSMFNGQTYIGDPAMNKKEAEQRAARAVVESILADSNTRRLMCEIVRSKRKLYAAFCKKSCSSGLLSEKKNSLRSHPNDNQVPVNICSGDEQIAKAAARETFTPEAITSCTSNSPYMVKLTEPSAIPVGYAGVVLTRGTKRSNAMKNGGNASEKARTSEQGSLSSRITSAKDNVPSPSVPLNNPDGQPEASRQALESSRQPSQGLEPPDYIPFLGTDCFDRNVESFLKVLPCNSSSECMEDSDLEKCYPALVKSQLHSDTEQGETSLFSRLSRPVEANLPKTQEAWRLSKSPKSSQKNDAQKPVFRFEGKST